jgi:hypothetical protein
MNCEQTHDALPLYLSGELRGQELADMQLHLQSCRRCAEAVRADSELDDALRSAMQEQAPDVSAVLRRVHERIAEPWWKRKRMPGLASVRMAVAVAVIVVISLTGIATLYVRRAQRNVALEAASDHYLDLVELRHPDWQHTPGEVSRFMETQFPQNPGLLPAITPDKTSFEKVRLCNLQGTTYAHFVFTTGTAETSVFLLASRLPYHAAHLSDAQHGLEVAGFSSAGLTGIVVGQPGRVSTLEIAGRIARTL